MTVLSAKQFSAETGFPLKLIRRLCRTGLLPHWRSGKVYLLDKDQALSRMQMLKEQVLTRPPAPAPPVRIRGRSAAKASEGSTGTERLKALLKKRKTATAATAAVKTEGRSGRSGSPAITILPQNRKCGSYE